MKLIRPFSIKRKDENKELSDYAEHKEYHRFLTDSDNSIEKANVSDAERIAQSNIQASKNISQSIDRGFDKVTEQTHKINESIIDQTKVIQKGFDVVEVTLKEGFKDVKEGLDDVTEGLENVDSSVNKVSENVLIVGEQVTQGLQAIKSAFDMGMMNIVSQFELQRSEIQQGFDQLAHLLENSHKTRARERYIDGKTEYEKYLQFPEEPQFLIDAHDYLLQSVEIYKGNPFCHLYLGHIYQEPGTYFNLQKSLKHYKLCATYSKGIQNNPLTALGYFMAAWISYVLGNVNEAIMLGELSLKYDANGIPENHYNLAKYFAYLAKPSRSLHYLNGAIKQFDPLYSLKAEVDLDFETIRPELDTYFDNILDEEAMSLERNLLNFGIHDGLLL